MWPSIITTFPRPAPTDRLNSPSHSGLENLQSSTIGQIQAFVGTNSSAIGTLLYDVRSPDSNGGGHIQTANKGGTGQTTYAKGDILVAQSNSVLSKLSASATNGLALITDSTQAVGVKWGNPQAINVQSILTTGVWNKPSTLSATSKILVELWAGGGSGGYGDTNNEAGGGGGGAYNFGFFTPSTFSGINSVLVGIGLGGNAVTGSSQNGITGGDTVFNPVSSWLTAYGGGGGGASPVGASGGGGGGNLTAGIIAGGGGSILGGNGGITNVAGGNGYYGGGGGGDGQNGGRGMYGGGGGGGVRASLIGLGGPSGMAANGGRSSIMTVGSAMAGGFPSGGGGGGYGNSLSSSGPGGNGMAVITTFL